jgi:hypothetical protein
MAGLRANALFIVAVGSLCGAGLLVQAAETADKAETKSRVETKNKTEKVTAEQARREVRIVDDLYKTAIVFMNDVYVVDENSVAAGETARHLFDAMKTKGWHEARLIDGTGEPLNDENEPTGDFEKKAIKKILKGETYYDEVVREDGQNYLRAATVVPVINDKCVICHPGSKVGDVMGAISYKVLLK